MSLASAQYEDYMRVLRRLAQTAVRTETARNVAPPRYLGYRPTVGAAVSPRAWWMYVSDDTCFVYTCRRLIDLSLIAGTCCGLTRT